MKVFSRGLKFVPSLNPDTSQIIHPSFMKNVTLNLCSKVAQAPNQPSSLIPQTKSGPQNKPTNISLSISISISISISLSLSVSLSLSLSLSISFYLYLSLSNLFSAPIPDLGGLGGARPSTPYIKWERLIANPQYGFRLEVSRLIAVTINRRLVGVLGVRLIATGLVGTNRD